MVGDWHANEVSESGIWVGDSGEVEVWAVGSFSLEDCVLVFHWWNLLGWLGESKVGAEGEVVRAEAGAGEAGQGGKFGVGIEVVNADQGGLGRVGEAGARADGSKSVCEFLGEDASVVVARGVVEIATKDEGEGFVFENWNGLFEICDLLGDGCNESVESLADLGDGPVESPGAERSGGVDSGGENPAVWE